MRMGLLAFLAHSQFFCDNVRQINVTEKCYDGACLVGNLCTGFAFSSFFRFFFDSKVLKMKSFPLT
jgi:hypothetical protein